MELKLRTEVALCILSLEDRQAWREGLALPGLPGQDRAEPRRAGDVGASSGLLQPGREPCQVWVCTGQACCPRHPQTRCYLSLRSRRHFYEFHCHSAAVYLSQALSWGWGAAVTSHQGPR